jgi:hypothetical protein
LSWGNDEDKCPKCTFTMEKFRAHLVKGKSKRSYLYYGIGCENCGENQILGKVPKRADPEDYGDLIYGIGTIETRKLTLTL